MAEVSCRAGGTALCLSRGFKSAGEQRFLSRLVTVSDSYRAVKLNSEAASEQELQQRKSFHMDSNSAGSVQYDRWNEDNIHMNVEASQSSLRRICNSLCVGSTGKAVKAAGAVAALLAVYIIGYVTGYYIHRCP